MKDTVLITGGTGFLGKHLGRSLANKYNVVLAGRYNKHNMDAQHFSGCLALPMDVTHIESIRSAAKTSRIDAICDTSIGVAIHLLDCVALAVCCLSVDGCTTVSRVAIALRV